MTDSISKALLPDGIEEQVELIATDVDFERYLDVVNSDSQRTRAVIFVLVAALLLIFTAYRNTGFPDWTDARLGHFQRAAICLETGLKSAECAASTLYAKNFLMQSAQENEVADPNGKEFSLELREQINQFIKQRSDALSLRLPFFGITIDMNDLGMICGLLLIAILFVLYANLKSETDDLTIAWRKAWDMDEKKRDANLTLLLMTQVLASPSKSKVGVGQGLYVLFVLTPLLHFFVVKMDIQTFTVGAVLEGKGWAIIDTMVDLVAFVFVLVGSGFCFKEQRKLNQALGELIRNKDPRPPGPPSTSDGTSAVA